MRQRKVFFSFLGILLVAGFVFLAPLLRSQVKALSLRVRGSMVLAAPAIPEAEPSSQNPQLFQNTMEHRILAPTNTKRVLVEKNSFGAWLRRLPLLPKESKVFLYNGALKARQDVHEAVVDLDVGQRDLQQCADAIMRLRSEYLFSLKKPIEFHPDVGKKRVLRFISGDRTAFSRYLNQVFTEAGSASLQAELLPVFPISANRSEANIQPGDVLIQGGFPGHAVLVLDVAEDKQGKQYLLLGQSYMPAQQFHVLKNLEDPSLSPWFEASTLQNSRGLQTPEWRPFYQKDVRRFPKSF